MTSAAFETIGEPKILYGRDAYLPEWTPVFTDSDLGVSVTQDGRDLGFTIRDMLPERRWAVLPTGETLSQRDFEEKFILWMQRVARGNRIVPISADNPYFDPKLIATPRVEHFVSRTLDYNGKEVAIGFEPNRAPSQDAIVVPVTGGNVVDPANPERAKLERLTLISSLKERGMLSAEDAASEMALILLEPQPAIPAPPPGFDLVAEAAPEASSETIAHVAKCGYAARSAAGRSAHERKCDDCQTTPEVAA